jgi:predicted ABC-class ATPase
LKNDEGSLFDDGFRLYFDRIQSDPYAPPSKIRLRQPLTIARLPDELLRDECRRVAVCDYLTRQVDRTLRDYGPREARIDAPQQHVLERSSCVVRDGYVEARLALAMPANGRRILGHAANRLVCGALPELVARTLRYASLDAAALRRHVECYEDQEFIRRHELPRLGLVAFVGDGARLPRASGASDRPLANCVPFRSPDSMRVTVNSKPVVVVSRGLCFSNDIPPRQRRIKES